jgi:hypothetical protein
MNFLCFCLDLLGFFRFLDNWIMIGFGVVRLNERLLNSHGHDARVLIRHTVHHD